MNRLLRLSPGERRRGVVAASAGNHGQAVARNGAALGVPATVVAPASAPSVKLRRMREFGADVVCVDGDVDACLVEARRMAAEADLTLVHPFDDADVVAGQGTVLLEMLDQGPELDRVIVPVGGGGLLAGVAAAAAVASPHLEILGVQSEGCRSWGRPGGVREAVQRSLADGIAVRNAGDLPYALAADLVDEVMGVSEVEIARAIAMLFDLEGLTVEGAGAAGLAAILAAPERFPGRNGLILSGGNIDPVALERARAMASCAAEDH